MHFFYYLTITIFTFVLRAVVTNGEVVEYGDGVFNTKIYSYRRALVNFYVDWCAYCRLLNPEFKKAEEIITQKNLGIKFITVNCEKGGSKTCSHYRVGGYPKVTYFVNGNVKEDYKKDRDADAIVRYLFHKMSKSSQDIRWRAVPKSCRGK